MKRKYKILTGVLGVLLAAAGILLALSLYGKKQMEKIPLLTAEECLQYTLKNQPQGCITVGLFKDGVTYHMYGENGTERPLELHIYEIGSITKTMTAALAEKAMEAGKLRPDASVDTYLSYETGHAYPTIQELLTHTSGCRSWYFATPMVKNFLSGENDYRGITGEMLRKQGEKLDLKEDSYPWAYSNFGIALLGLSLEQVNGEPFEDQLNRFLQEELGLQNTGIFHKPGDLQNYWTWNPGDAYMPAGAVTSDIRDMMAYAALQLEDQPPFSACHEKIREVRATPKRWELMDIRADSMAMAWILDEKNNFIWHNGATDHFNSYLGFCRETDTAVVVLSNLSPGFRIPATVIGPKLLKQIQ